MSSVTYLTCGIPQGSVISPILFVLYTVNLLSVMTIMDCVHTCMQMTRMFMVLASRLPYLHLLQRSPNASKQLRRGCNPIASV